MNESDRKLDQIRDLISIGGGPTVPLLAALLARQGLSPESADVLSAVLAQSLPLLTLQVLEYRHLPMTREGREAARIREVIETLGQLIVREDVQPVHLRQFIEEHPVIFDLFEVVLREAEAETDRRKLKHYAQILKHSLMFSAASDVQAEETATMVRALRQLSDTDIHLLKIVERLQHPPQHPVPGATVRVNGSDVVNELKRGSFNGGYLTGRLALLTQFGFLIQEVADQPSVAMLRLGGDERNFEGFRQTYTLSSYGQAFLEFCILEGDDSAEV